MAVRLVNIDRNTPLLLPPDLRDWVPDDHIVHFVLEAVEVLDLQGFRVNERGTGDEQYPPAMLLGLLVYCYATGRFSSREIEQATYSDVAVRYVCGNTHPDHDTICTFRRVNGALFKECFVKVLGLASELGHLRRVGGISVDGTKIQANASKHAAVSYERAGAMIGQLELEVEELMHKPEDADSTPLDDGFSIPAEIARRPLGADDVHLDVNSGHSDNFLDCVRTRKRTICDAETAHRSASLMLLGGIAQRLRRKLTWDPRREVFPDDDEANRMLSVAKRPPWHV